MTADGQTPAPITEFDSAPTAIIEPSKVYEPIPDLPTVAVMSWMRDAVQRCYDEHPTSEVFRFTAETIDVPICRVEIDGTPIVVVEAQVGAPVSAALLEVIIALGVRSVFAVGSSGGLTAKHPPCTVIVPTAAIRDEGTSYHYAPSSERVATPAAAMQEMLTEALSEAGFETASGLVWTTDAIFRETQSRVAARIDEGALAVDMEASALAAVAEFRGIELGQAVYVADTLFGEEWDGDALLNPDSDFRYRLFTTVLGVAVARSS